LNNSDKMTIASAEYFNIIYCGYIPRYDCRCRINSDCYELQYVAAGGVELEFGGKRYLIEGGGGWLIHPGTCYTYQPQEKFGWWEHRYIVFSGSAVNGWRDGGLLPEQPWRIPSRRGFGVRLDRIIELARQLRVPLNRIEAANLLEKIFIDLRRAVPTASEPSWLERILSRLDTAPGAPDYHKLAAACGMSRRTMFRRFLAETGHTPHQYYLRSRVKMAARLLETTNLSIKDIAARLGYADPAHFARQFKAVSGSSPGEYRSRPFPMESTGMN